MNYEEKSNFEISKRVAEIVYNAVDVMELAYLRDESSAVWNDPANGLMSFNLNDPSDAWPIIVENKINVNWFDDEDGDYASCTTGEVNDNRFLSDHENPLRAAMICFLKMKEV